MKTSLFRARPHLWYQLYWVLYLLWFFWLDLTVTDPNYIIHLSLIHIWHTAQRDHAVHMAVDSHDFIRLVQAGDEHLVAHLLGGVALEVFLVARCV